MRVRHDERPSNWHDAVALATFDFYEPANARERWAGGYSSDGDSIEVIGDVDGAEVLVRTARPARQRANVFQLRANFMESAWPFVMEDLADVDLPYSITFEDDSRVVSVEGKSRTFAGVRVRGSRRWIGTLELDDHTVTIATSSDATLALRICADQASLPESPPPLH